MANVWKQISGCLFNHYPGAYWGDLVTLSVLLTNFFTVFNAAIDTVKVGRVAINLALVVTMPGVTSRVLNYFKILTTSQPLTPNYEKSKCFLISYRKII